jgi:hypothetical protein
MQITRKFGWISSLSILTALTSTDCTPKEAQASATPVPILAELFTSEGCSSCPPADAILAELEAKQPVNGAVIIPLAFHVDYWNNLGWRDPFSSADWTDRQRTYARALKDDSVYTPELVIDGRESFVGSRGGHAQDAIADATKRPKANLNLTVKEVKGVRSLAIVVGALPAGSAAADVIVAITEPHAQVNVTGGENGGRALDHTAIVKSLRVLGVVAAAGGSFEIPAEPAFGSKRAVVFVQERASRSVLGVATLTL